VGAAAQAETALSSTAARPDPSDRTPARTDQVLAEQLRLIFSQAPAALLITCFSIATVLTLLWRVTPHTPLIAWGGFALAVTAGRFLLVELYRRRRPSAAARVWLRRYLAGAAAGGSVFGAAAALIPLTPSPAHQVLLIFVIGGMAGGAISSMSAILPAYISFALLAIVPLVAAMLHQGGEVYSAISILLALYAVFMIGAARQVNRSVLRSLGLAFDNDQLVTTLSAAHAQAETINRDLQEAVHQQRLAREALFQEKERAQVTLESIGDAVITTDVNGRIDYLNPVAASLTGWSQDEARGRHLDEILRLVDESTDGAIDAVFQRCLSLDPRDRVCGETLVVHRDGDTRHAIEITASAIRDRAGAIAGSVLVFHDVTELRGLARQMSYQASHDALTGLINRREFDARLEAALAAVRQHGRHHALMYIDLDQFKIVNDSCGHLAGDELLKQLAELLQATIRDNDVLARLGGDEFGVLLQGCTLDNALPIAEKLLRIVHEFHFVWEGRSFDVGMSIGLVPLTADLHDRAELLRAADAACYVAKDEGRNRIHVYLRDDQTIAQRHGEMQWLQRIKQALAEDEFELHYQPVVPIDAGGGLPSHCEVLLRMRDAGGRLIPPLTFLPAAERYQLMPQIDRWVVSKVLGTLSAGGSVLGDYDICAINLSGQSLGDEDFLDFVLLELAEAGLAPERLCFEITETAAIANFQRASQFVTRLRAMGCRFALDDFGSGLSSFGYLKSLPVDYLKIDGRFVRDIVDDRTDRTMVEAVNRIGHVMGKQTIAEFVENDAILALLRELGVDYAQGYGIAMPQPVSAPGAAARRGRA